jgi:hypothetical protein
VQGLKSAKEIWDVLKTAHEGDEVTKITKRETTSGVPNGMTMKWSRLFLDHSFFLILLKFN